ncbi:MAG: nucleoside hydrolase [Planctomycetes bacterium]|nr:nucleoside hydrolase [Planctomycetota bacterium]
MVQKIIIDADAGIGDAVAVALALFDPQIDVIAVTATAGCVSGQAVTRNLQAVIEALDPPKWPRLGGSTAVVPTNSGRGRDDAITAETLDGPGGLGDFEFEVADLHNLRDAAKVMIDAVRNDPNEITLLTLGPLTNVKMASELLPGFLGLLKGLYCQGGSVECGGDVTAAAEFNIFANPEAARHVLHSAATKTLVPLDVSRRPVLTFELFDRVRSRSHAVLAEFLGRLLPFAFRVQHNVLGCEGVPLHEVTALCAISQPRLFESQPMSVEVETSGDLTRGMTVFDRRGIPQWQENIDVLNDVDTQGVLDYFDRIVAGSVL